MKHTISITAIALVALLAAASMNGVWAKGEEPSSLSINTGPVFAGTVAAEGDVGLPDSRLPGSLPAYKHPGTNPPVYTPVVPGTCSKPEAHFCGQWITVACEKPTASRRYFLKCGGDYEI